MPPQIDRKKCEGCGICVFVCGKHVFSFRPESSSVIAPKAKECVNCFLCQDFCRAGAITVKVKIN